MIYVLIFITLLMKESKGVWKLVWSEEFQNQTLDTEKWEVENESIPCHGNNIGQSNCNTNSTRNLRLINGTLAITAIYEKYLDKDYTSAKITTKQGFTYGRFEIRAALPNGKMLRSAIFMIPVTTSVWAKNGQIDIMTNSQTLKLGNGLHYNIGGVYDTNNMGDFTANTSLNDFHTYAIEWNQFEIKWFFDDINHLTININRSLGPIYIKNGKPFDSPFRLLIHLGVGSLFFPNQALTVEDVMNWKCSLLIIDYVRIYEWVNGTKKHYSKEDRVSTDNICSHVMLLIAPNKKGNGYLLFSLNRITIPVIISLITSSLFIVLLTVIVFLFIKQKKLKRINVKNNYENYDYILDKEEYTLNTSGEYAYRYEEISDNFVESDKTEEYIKPDPIYLEVFE